MTVNVLFMLFLVVLQCSNTTMTMCVCVCVWMCGYGGGIVAWILNFNYATTNMPLFLTLAKYVILFSLFRFFGGSKGGAEEERDWVCYR